ncbi:hypothetical protein TNCT_319021 [Trichonephila clavata]|uniref:Uncharacterized protein n=1 Tax=Trichonephila clavata TaxID=2740835 RepID=A0A8X6GSS4_TRICU|nr:hypothetical protein TNCT_319021 [Trichonephila clavata]
MLLAPGLGLQYHIIPLLWCLERDPLGCWLDSSFSDGGGGPPRLFPQCHPLQSIFTASSPSCTQGGHGGIFPF